MKRRILGVFLVAFACLPASQSVAKNSLPDRARVEVRAVTWKGQVLVDRKVIARTTKVRTSRKASCLGGDPTDGRVTLAGTTATGALQRAVSGLPGLKPSFTNAYFDQYGLGLCAIGRHSPGPEGWWQLRVNGAITSKGGDATFLRRGDRVLWYLHDGGESPDELRLIAPAAVRRGDLATVRVRALNDRGRSRQAEGVRILANGVEVGRTNGEGRLRVRIRSRTRLEARMTGTIPSNRTLVRVKVGSSRLAQDHGGSRRGA